MSKTKLKIIVTIVVLLFTFSSVLSFAAPTVFTDIDGHWGEKFIEDVYERKLITGYLDATFKPQNNITKLEAIVIISKLMGYTDNEEQYYINQYKEQLEDSNIPDWGQGAVAYALFNDILLEEELKSLVSTTGQTYARRHEVATYIGRVLQYGAGEELGKIYVIPYKDEMSIPNIAKPYIDLLLNKEILDKTSNDGRFLPNNEITRAEVAKLISLSAEILDNVSDDDIIVEPGPITPPSEITVRKTVDGYIDNIIFGDKNIVSIEDDGSRLIYEIDSEANININGRDATVEQLEIGQTITAIVEDNIIIDIKATSSGDVLEGYFYYYYLQGQTMNVFIKDKKDETHSLSFTSNSKLYLNDKAVDIEDLNLGDAVTVTYINDEIVKIEAEPKEKYFEGVVRAKNDNKDDYTLEVLLDDNTIKTFTIESKTRLRRDRRSARFEDIKVGDEVEITTEYGTVTLVNAYSVKKTVEGYIKKIDIGPKTEITVEKYNGTTEIFTLTPDTVIRVERERTGIYDLRLNYEVELEIENDEVLWVETYRKLQDSNYSGKITYIDVRRGILELQVGAREEIEIYVDDETIFNDEYGDLITFRDLYVGDEIVVVAEDNGYYITAKRVIVIIRR